MAYRSKLSRNGSRKLFKKNTGVHKANLSSRRTRGGTRW